MMKKSTFVIAASILLILICVNADAQKAASYCYGEYGKPGYEHFSFWARNGRPDSVDYSYGTTPRDISLAYLGKGNYRSKRAFTIAMPNGKVLYVIPVGLKIRVVSVDGRFNKLLSWEYEGPFNGIGAYCSVCAHSKREAIRTIHIYTNFHKRLYHKSIL